MITTIEFIQILFALLAGVAALFIAFLIDNKMKEYKAKLWFYDNEARVSSTFKKYGFYFNINRTYAGDAFSVRVEYDDPVWREMEQAYKREPRGTIYLQDHHLLALYHVMQRSIETKDPSYFKKTVIGLFPYSTEYSSPLL